MKQDNTPRDYTQLMSDAIWDIWGKSEDTSSPEEVISFLSDSSTFRSFGDGLVWVITKKKPSLTGCTPKEIAKSVLSIFNDKKIKFNRNTLDSWLTSKKRPKKGDDSRENLFRLSFALDLTDSETAYLFQKVYLDRSFNPRCKKEFIYYYCLSHHKDYQHAQTLLDKVDNNRCAVGTDEFFPTQQLMDDVSALKSDEEIVQYILSHASAFEFNSVLSIKKRDELLEDARRLTQEEISDCEQYKYDNLLKNKTKSSVSTAFQVVVDQMRLERNEKRTSIFKDSLLPSEIKINFPQSNIMQKKDPSYDELRKSIILLFSYQFWRKNKLNVGTESIGNDEIFETFETQLSALLNDIGFPPLYYGNPYDWLFLYCTSTEKPLDTFRELIAEATGSAD